MTQQQLPFGWKFDEQRAALVRAFRRSRLQPVDRQLALYVHEVSQRGGPLRKTYNELADTLDVHRNTVRNSVSRLIDAGLLIVDEERYRTGGQRENAYSIDWEGVRSPTPQEAAHKICAPPAKICAPPAKICAPYKEQEALLFPLNEAPSSSSSSFSRTVKEEEAEEELSWDEVRAQLAAAGVVMVADAIAGARRQGLSPQATAELVAAGHEPGALFIHLTQGGWPTGYDPPGKRSCIRLRRVQTETDQDRAARAAAEAEAAEQEREASLGAVLDRLPRDERQQLAERTYGDFIGFYHRNRDGPEVRRDLLAQLAKENQAQEEP